MDIQIPSSDSHGSDMLKRLYAAILFMVDEFMCIS